MRVGESEREKERVGGNVPGMRLEYPIGQQLEKACQLDQWEEKTWLSENIQRGGISRFIVSLHNS